MYVCTGKEYTGMNDQINKQRNKFNQFLIDKTNYQVHAPTETKQLLITVKLTKPWTSNGMMCCEEKASKAWEN